VGDMLSVVTASISSWIAAGTIACVSVAFCPDAVASLRL